MTDDELREAIELDALVGGARAVPLDQALEFVAAELGPAALPADVLCGELARRTGTSLWTVELFLARRWCRENARARPFAAP